MHPVVYAEEMTKKRSPRFDIFVNLNAALPLLQEGSKRQMIVRFQSNLLVVTAESEDERESLVCWSEDLDGCVFILKRQDEQTFRLISAGPELEARREPINVTSRSLAPLDLISNFAHTPFALDGRRYASVEAFWQGLATRERPSCIRYTT